jgi:hypothetical protein
MNALAGLVGEIAPTVEDRLLQINDAWIAGDTGEEGSNSARGARILVALMGTYHDDPQGSLRDALTDLRHACDLLGLTFDEEDGAAHRSYRAEVCEHGPAPCITEGWT